MNAFGSLIENDVTLYPYPLLSSQGEGDTTVISINDDSGVVVTICSPSDILIFMIGLLSKYGERMTRSFIIESQRKIK